MTCDCFPYQYTAETCPGRPCSTECDHRGLPPTITINGRTYGVEVLPDREQMQRPVYRLTGARGADYTTMRVVPKPDQMFLFSTRKGLRVDPLPGVWLTDRNGTLEVL